MLEVTKTLQSRLQDPSLVCGHAYVAGRNVKETSDGKTFEVRNPSTGEILAELPDLGPEHVELAVDAAIEAQRVWAATTGIHKSAMLKEWHRL